eukprot:gene9937-biopygen7041
MTARSSCLTRPIVSSGTPASAECAADWFTKQLLRCGAHLPKQAPGTRSSTTAFRHARAEALAAVQAVDSLAPETPPEIREAAIAYVTRKVKEYRSALVGTAGKKERLHDPVTAWKLYRRCQDEARQSVPREVQFPRRLRKHTAAVWRSDSQRCTPLSPTSRRVCYPR